MIIKKASKLPLFLMVGGYFFALFLIGFENSLISLFGKFLVYGAVLSIVVFSLFNNYKLDKLFLFSLFPFVFWIGVRSDNIYGVAIFLQFAFVYFLSSVKVPLGSVSGGAYQGPGFHNFFLFLYLCFLALSVFGVSLFSNPNYLGAVGLVLFCLRVSAGVKVGLFSFLFYFALVALTFSRASALGVLVVYLAVVFLPGLSRGWMVPAFLLSVLVLVGGAEYIFSLDFSEANRVSLDLIGKRFETGRLDFWKVMFSDFAASDYVFGMGGGLDLESIVGKSISAHSTYVSLVFSYGFVGLILFVVAVLGIFYRMLGNGEYLGVAASLGLIFRDFFETSIVHNSFPIAIAFWCFCLSWCVSCRRENNGGELI